MSAGAKYYPATGKLYARIALDGKIIAIFKLAPSDTQGEAMAKSILADAPTTVSQALSDELAGLFTKGFLDDRMVNTIVGVVRKHTATEPNK